MKEINEAYSQVMKLRQGGGSSYGGASYGGSSYGGSSYGGYGGSSYGGYGYGRSSGSQGGGYASSEQFQDIREMISRGLILQAVSALDRIQNRTAEHGIAFSMPATDVVGLNPEAWLRDSGD